MLVYLICNYFTGYPYCAFDTRSRAEAYLERIPKPTRVVEVYVSVTSCPISEQALECLMGLAASNQG